MADPTPTPSPAPADGSAYLTMMQAYVAAVQSLVLEMRADRAATEARFERRLAQDDRNERLRADSMRDHTTRMCAAMAGESVPDPLPATPAPPPEKLSDEQAVRYLALYADEFRPFGITTPAAAAQHWVQYGRGEWLAGKRAFKL